MTDFDKFFLVDDPSETGIARDLVNSGALSEDIVSMDSGIVDVEVASNKLSFVPCRIVSYHCHLTTLTFLTTCFHM